MQVMSDMQPSGRLSEVNTAMKVQRLHGTPVSPLLKDTGELAQTRVRYVGREFGAGTLLFGGRRFTLGAGDALPKSLVEDSTCRCLSASALSTTLIQIT